MHFFQLLNMQDQLIFQGVYFAWKFMKRGNYTVPQLSCAVHPEDKRQRKRARSCWAFPVSSEYFDTIWRDYSDGRFFQKYRMNRALFTFICDHLRDEIKKNDTPLRFAVPVEKRVAVALHLLKSCCDHSTVGDLYGVGESTTKMLLHEFCNAVIKILKPIFLKRPTHQQLQSYVDGFEEKWDFPGTIGALDGSHIPILRPDHCGADYYNYKKYFSINLMAVCDHEYKFWYCNVGQAGKNADSTVFARTQLHNLLSNGTLMNAGHHDWHLISDAAFSLQNWLMKPFPDNEFTPPYQLEFNFRLSRARMVIENSFGRLKGRWRILLKRMDCNVDTVIKIVETCVILHNICESKDQLYMENWMDGDDTRAELAIEQPEMRPNNSASSASKLKRERIAQTLFKE